MNKYKRLIGIAFLIASIFLYISAKYNPIRETIIYFPIDPTVSFLKASTSLSNVTRLPDNFYSFRWKTESLLDRKAYLRQDVGLLFSNGRLVGKLGEWKENTDRIIQEKKIKQSGSALIQALTFHYAEIHHNEAEIFSAQTMSSASGYIINTPFQPLTFFQKANSEEEKKWKQILDDKTSKELQAGWERSIKAFSIQLNHYHPYPLTQFYRSPDYTLPEYSKEETERIIGNLWEGLYKNYFLGIKKADGTTVSPNGSIVPLILLAKDKTELLVITETAKGEPILLRQMIEYGH